ncbi:hypothetical protein NE237_007695 [Protea cynaroides]|uniref:Uncharacterized protein n=1 Tax=Protea cynaroides TaxID=273540 RepID=A0A9Q0KQJ9_9MAGN|nr:hypothetical protein NE237_007695 [Protea cynaroides]
MFLTEYARRIPPFSHRHLAGKRFTPSTKNLDLISQSFDEKLIRGLKTLNPPSVNLSWLSLAIDFLSSIHAEAESLVSDLKLSSSDNSLASYLDDSIKLLDLCNSIVSEIERFRQGRLLLVLGIQRLRRGQDLESEELCRVRDSLSDWGNRSQVLKTRMLQSPRALIEDLSRGLGNPPLGKITTVGKVVERTIYTVGAVTLLIGAIMVAVLTKSPETIQVRVPAEFSWADSFGQIERRFQSGREPLRSVELDNVKACVGSVCDVIDNVVAGGEGVISEGNKVKLEKAVTELETVTVTLTEGLDRSLDGVNKLFRTVLNTRNSLLGKCQVASGCESERKSEKMYRKV